jgi:hypothetical protein
MTGMGRTAWKEEIQKEIEAQQDLGSDNLLEEDQFLAEVNLSDLEASSGEHQEYCLVAICTAWEAGRLRGIQLPSVRRGNGIDIWR